MADTAALRVLQLNTWNVEGPWPQRLQEIVAQIRRLQPDVVCLQEVVSGPDGRSSAHILADALVAGGSHPWHVAYAGTPYPEEVLGVPEGALWGVAVLSRWPVPVSFAGDRACYLPVPDRIQLPDRTAFHSAGALYATWAHEVIHSTGHSSRLARDLSGGMGESGDGGRAYAREELVAELGAVLLGDRLEIGSAMANHAAYLGHWVELLKESPRVLLQVLSDARKAADLVCQEAPDAAGG